MTTTSEAQAYALRNKLVYPNGDFDYEAELIEFPGWKKAKSGFWAPLAATVGGNEGNVIREQKGDGRWHVVEFKLPNKIEFETVGDIIHHTDYPDCKPWWPIMSKRMLDTLLSVQEFPHQTIPVTMIDTQRHYDESVGKYIVPREGLEDFVAVQLLEHLDLFDWEKSVYTLELEQPITINRLERMVLKEQDGGFPPLFRIATGGVRTRLYVSPQGRAALEDSDIRGVDFINALYSG